MKDGVLRLTTLRDATLVNIKGIIISPHSEQVMHKAYLHQSLLASNLKATRKERETNHEAFR